MDIDTKKNVIFFAYFKSSNACYHSIEDIREFIENDDVPKFYEWVVERKDNLEKEFNTSVVIVNCKIIK